MPKYIIQITDGGDPVGYVGPRTLEFDRRADRLRADYLIVQDANKAMKYVTRDAAEWFAEDFNRTATSGVGFRVEELPDQAEMTSQPSPSQPSGSVTDPPAPAPER